MKRSTGAKIFTRWKRRDVLRGLGAGAAFLTPLLRTVRAEAQGVYPKRLVVFFHISGTIRGEVQPTIANGTVTLPPLLKSLEPVKRKVTVVERVANWYGNAGNAHAVGGQSILTGSVHPSLEHGQPTNESIDHLVQRLSGKPGLRVVLPNLGIEQWAVCWNNQRQALGFVGNPGQLFDGLLAPNVKTTQIDVARSQAEGLAAKRRQAVFNEVVADAQMVRTRLPSVEQKKLDYHLEGVNTLVKGLNLDGKNQVLAAPGCALPARNVAVGDAATAMRSFTAIIKTAMACDLTRSVVVHCPFIRTPTLDAANQGNHHGLSHWWETPGDVNRTNQWRKVLDYQYGMYGHLVNEINSVAEGDKTMLDNSVVVACSELAGPGHDLGNIPMIISGQCGGRIPGGRQIRIGNSTRIGPHAAVNTTDFWTTVAQGMGFNVQVFGTPGSFNGGIPQLLV
jgi:hypothetical protein